MRPEKGHLGHVYQPDRRDPPGSVEIARQAARIVGLHVAGIDFITLDITLSVRDVV